MAYEVELIREGKAVKQARVQAGRFTEAAQIWGPVTAPNGKEPIAGEWIRVTHLASGRTSWFRPS